MNLVTIANVATALTVLTGVIFGLVEAQRARRFDGRTGAWKGGTFVNGLAGSMDITFRTGRIGSR